MDNLVQYLTEGQQQEIQKAIFEKVVTQIKSQKFEIDIREILEEEITEMITYSIKEVEFDSLNEFFNEYVLKRVKESLGV